MLRKTASGFTLMEMMAALSIIATLSALLYPVVSHSLRRAYVTSCQSQLRQIGVGIKMYQADYEIEDWPCHISRLIPQYVSSQVIVCPWVERAASREVGELRKSWNNSWASYFVFCRQGLDEIALRRGEITFSEIMEQRGERTPMVICREHRDPFVLAANHPMPLMAWCFPEAPVVVLRKDGSVDLSMKGGLGFYASTMRDAQEL